MLKNAVIFVISAALGLGITIVRRGMEPPPPADPAAANTPGEASPGKDTLLAYYRGIQTPPEIFAELDGVRIISGAELEHSAIGLLIARAAVIDPRATLDYLIRPEAEHLRRCGFPALLNVWVRQDRAGALATISAMEGSAIKSEIELRMLHALAEQDPAEAFRVISTNAAKQDNHSSLNRTYRTFLNWGYKDRDAASAAIGEIKDPDVRENALQGLAAALTRTDIAAAMDWAAAFPGDEDESRSLMRTVFSQAFLTDATRARELLELRVSALDDDEALRLAGANLHGLLRTDPKRTIDFITTRFEGTAEEPRARAWLLDQLSRFYPETAVALIDENYSGNLDRESEEACQVQGAYLEALCRTDDEQALALLAADASLIGRIEDRTMDGLLGRQDPEVAAHFVLTHFPPGHLDRALGRVLDRWDLAEARRWAEENVADPEIHQGLSQQFEQRAATEDPARFAPLLIDRPDTPANRQLTRSVAFRLAIDDPTVAADWAKDISDPQLQRMAVAVIAGQWLDQDSMSAGKWIAGIPPGKTRNEAIRLLVKAVSPVDPAEAAAWKALIVEEEE